MKTDDLPPIEEYFPMKFPFIFLSIFFLSFPVIGLADTEKEIKELIVSNLQYTSDNLSEKEGTLSKQGSLEFWSSGGLLVDNNKRGTRQWEVFQAAAKHIEVITLVEGRAAVAQFYQEAVMKPVGSALVSNYRTRVTQVFVKEDGQWRVAAAHYSPLVGGAGTSQTVANEN
jgi:hypothetical protein